MSYSDPIAKPMSQGNVWKYGVGTVVVLLVLAGAYGSWYLKQHSFDENSYAPLGSAQQFVTGKVVQADTTCSQMRIISSSDQLTRNEDGVYQGRAVSSSGTFKTVGTKDIANTYKVVQANPVDKKHPETCLLSANFSANTTIDAQSTALALLNVTINSDSDVDNIVKVPSFTEYKNWLAETLRTHTVTNITNTDDLHNKLISYVGKVNSEYTRGLYKPQPTALPAEVEPSDDPAGSVPE